MPDYIERIIQFSLEHPELLIIKEINVGDNNGRFWLTSQGDVISICREQPLFKQTTDNGKGYKQFKLNGKTYYQHRLLAEYFLKNDNPKEKIEVHHLDFDKQNNSLSNLIWLTPDKHRIIHTLMRRFESMDNNI